MKNLPKNVVIDHGYLQARVFHSGHVYTKNFGLPSSHAIELASIWVAQKKKEILEERVGIKPVIPSKQFEPAARLYFSLWGMEKDAEGFDKHTKDAKYQVELKLNKYFIPFFKKFTVDQIRPLDIQRYREWRLKDGAQGTTVNREQNMLSSMFSHWADWIALEKVFAFKLPEKNPCQFVEKAPMRVRERVLTTKELSSLKQAFIKLNDPTGWDICVLGLKSLLRKKDLMRLEHGQQIDLKQAKTGLRVKIPIQVMFPNISWVNWRDRWVEARKEAQLDFPLSDPRNCQFKDLRKTGATLLSQQGFPIKSISEMLGHSSVDTTENHYLIRNVEHLKPLATALDKLVESL